MEARLKANIWIKAQLRFLDLRCIPAVISRRGDPDAGAIFIKLINGRGQAMVLSPGFGRDGERGWTRGTGSEPVPETEADAYLDRQADFDPDIWVLEIEDAKGLYLPEGRIFD